MKDSCPLICRTPDRRTIRKGRLRLPLTYAYKSIYVILSEP